MRCRTEGRRSRVRTGLAAAAGAALVLSACGGVENTAGGGSGGGYPSGTVEMPVGADPGGSAT